MHNTLLPCKTLIMIKKKIRILKIVNTQVIQVISIQEARFQGHIY